MIGHNQTVVINSSVDQREYFPNNNPGHFELILAKPVELNDNYQTALISIHMDATYVNVEKELVTDFVVLGERRDKKPLFNSITVMPGYYKTPQHLAKKIVESIDNYHKKKKALYDIVEYLYNVLEQRGRLTSSIHKYAFAEPKDGTGLLEYLGFSPLDSEKLAQFQQIVPAWMTEINNVINNSEGKNVFLLLPDVPLKASNPSKIVPINSIYVYSDFIQDQTVSNTIAPLMGLVPLNGVEPGGRIEHVFSPLIYSPLKKTKIDKMLIYMADDHGKPIKFYGGSTTIYIQFTRQSLL